MKNTTRRTQLLAGMSRRHRRPNRLSQLQINIGVEEILEPLDLQASVFVGDNVYDG
jgi:hypothetical protein